MKKTIITAVLLALALSGCSSQQEGKQQEASQKQRPPLPVNAFEVKERRVTIDKTYAVVIQPFAEVAVPARVRGELMEKHFDEGDFVQKGQLLFTIEQDVYETNLQQALADVQKAQAAFSKAKKDYERAKTLHESSSISDQDYDAYVFAYEDAKAVLTASKAAHKQAKIEYDYTTVEAPISGTAGMKLQEVGSIVGSNESNGNLLYITATDPVYAHFSLSKSDVQTYIDQFRSGEVAVSLEGMPKRKGTIDYISPSIQTDTDTLPMRAKFSNEDGEILSGEFTKIKVSGLKLDNVFVIPEKAILKTPKGNFVYTVKGGKAAMVPVTLGVLTDGGIVVKSGLHAGDKIITDNIAKVRPGANVQIRGSK